MPLPSSDNQTSFTECILLGFINIKQGKIFLFVFLLTLYTICFLGNSFLITVVLLNQTLHTPMYFFLGNLSFLDICYISVTVPKMLAGLWTESPSISFLGCAAQMYFFVTLVGTEGFLLASMALDRYFAICCPLAYTSLMNKWICLQLSVISWICGFLNASLHTTLTFHLFFCQSNKINHFFCDIPPLLSISCSDTSVNEVALLTIGVFVGLSPFFFTLFSYAFILHAILSNQQKGKSHKAISTCVSHLTVVILFYGSSIFTYVRPTSSYSLERDQFVGVLYSVLTPTLNLLIYSLRNKEVKLAMRKLRAKAGTNAGPAPSTLDDGPVPTSKPTSPTAPPVIVTADLPSKIDERVSIPASGWLPSFRITENPPKLLRSRRSHWESASRDGEGGPRYIITPQKWKPCTSTTLMDEAAGRFGNLFTGLGDRGEEIGDDRNSGPIGDEEGSPKGGEDIQLLRNEMRIWV
ncbi:olfactory receptor 5V1-like [Heteronotia binoei]|uniref:olfactory receptor 5V1-like n=1 Tax=Heteronotia binoei TaxID=13085 RepID=UPI00292CD3CB|nr:olfactory receptor 5V1-like [Heteronotia binoei]